jgi:hypothetical protein
MAMRDRGKAPAALELRERLGVEHSYAVFSIEQNDDA